MKVKSRVVLGTTIGLYPETLRVMLERLPEDALIVGNADGIIATWEDDL